MEHEQNPTYSVGGTREPHRSEQLGFDINEAGGMGGDHVGIQGGLVACVALDR